LFVSFGEKRAKREFVNIINQGQSNINRNFDLEYLLSFKGNSHCQIFYRNFNLNYNQIR